MSRVFNFSPCIYIHIAKSGTASKIIVPENRGDVYIYAGGKIKDTAHSKSFYYPL